MKRAGFLLVASALALGLAPALAAGQTRLTLDETRDLAVDRSPALRQAAARAESGSAGRIESWGRLLPSVRLSAGLNRSGTLQRTAEDPITGGIVALPDSLVEEREAFGTTALLSLDWTLFDGGRNWLAVRQSGALADASSLRLAAARAQARAGATIAFLDALEAEAQEEVRDAEAGRARTLLEAAETRFRTGAVPEIDMLQASLTLNEADLALEDARIEASAARAALAVYIGGLPAEAELLAPEATPVDAASLDDVAACAVEASPELAALRAEIEAAERGRSSARWSLLPTVGVGATMMRTEFGQTREAMTMDPRNTQAYYSLNLSWSPLDNPGAWLADRRRTDAELDEAIATFDGRQAEIARATETAVGRIRRARLAQERGELNVRMAQRQREQASERYRLGLAPITETIQAESLARAAERQAITARFGVLRALAELEQAAGIDPTDCR